MKKNNSVIYANYTPYENSGHILDYLKENFKNVYMFSIGFHNLGEKIKYNRLTHYVNGKKKSEKDFFYMHVPQSLVFILVPIRSAMNMMQMIYETYLIYRYQGKVDVFFSVNAFVVWVGMMLKKFRMVGETVFWVWDYYPIRDRSIIVSIMRWQYWQFDKIATKADRVVYLNSRLVKVRKDAGLIDKKAEYPLAAIGTGKPVKVKKKSLKEIKIGFIGVLKRSQGLDMIFNNAKELGLNFDNLTFEIIGSGPDANYFKKRAENLPFKVNFYGLTTEKKFANILSNCTIGIAPYVPEDTNVSKYGDPGKVKRYLEFNLPSIITDVFEFSQELQTSGAGIIVDYYKPKELVSAIKQISNNYKIYASNAKKLHKKYFYRKQYKVMFN